MSGIAFALENGEHKVVRVATQPGKLRGVALDDADLDEQDESRDLVSPLYLYDYGLATAARVKARGKGRSVSWLMDSMGAGGPFSSFKVVSRYRGTRQLALSDGKAAVVVTADVIEAEMKIPIVSWFTTIAFSFYVAERGGRRVLVGVGMTMPSVPPLLTWPLTLP